MNEIKLTFTVDEQTARRIDKYWHNRRLNNRAEALRLLVKQGLSELEDHDGDNPPTQKQIDLVKKLCKEKNIEPPEEWSLKSYSRFIYNHVKKDREEKGKQ